MTVIHDIDRPPKMLKVKEAIEEALKEAAPEINVTTDDNIMSSVTIRGSFDPKTLWQGGIFHNSRFFIISVVPEKGKRYYEDTDTKVEVHMTAQSHKVKGKLRKYTGPLNKVIEKIKKFIDENK